MHVARDKQEKLTHTKQDKVNNFKILLKHSHYEHKLLRPFRHVISYEV